VHQRTHQHPLLLLLLLAQLLLASVVLHCVRLPIQQQAGLAGQLLVVWMAAWLVQALLAAAAAAAAPALAALLQLVLLLRPQLLEEHLQGCTGAASTNISSCI
jgi:hypothetical protein